MSNKVLIENSQVLTEPVYKPGMQSDVVRGGISPLSLIVGTVGVPEWTSGRQRYTLQNRSHLLIASQVARA